MLCTCRSDQPLLFGKDYETSFDVQQYLQSYDQFHIIRSFPLDELHKLYLELKAEPDTLSVLDIGTGPCIAHAISVAPYASKIVWAEYTASNRAALTAWLQNQKDAHDWMPWFKKIVIEMEGKDEIEVERRANMLREKVKAVVPCDITTDPPIPQEYMRQYDIVQSILCLQAACQTKEECLAGIARMAPLVKPGGKIILYFVDQERAQKAFYCVGSEMFFSLPISKDSIVKEIKSSGFCDLKLTTLPRDQVTIELTSDLITGFYFVSATKE